MPGLDVQNSITLLWLRLVHKVPHSTTDNLQLQYSKTPAILFSCALRCIKSWHIQLWDISKLIRCLQSHTFSLDSAEKIISKTKTLSKDPATIQRNAFSSISFLPCGWTHLLQERLLEIKSLSSISAIHNLPRGRRREMGSHPGNKEANLAKSPYNHADNRWPGTHAHGVLSRESSSMKIF